MNNNVTNTKIAVIVPDLSSQGTTRGYLIARGLQALGYQVKIYSFLFGEQIYPEPPYALPLTYFYGEPLPGVIKTAFNLMKEIDADILYVIKPQLSSLGMALIKGWRSKKPIILDIDDWEMGQFGGDDWHYQGSLIGDILARDSDLKNPQFPLYTKWLEKWLEKVNGVTVSSKFLAYRYGGSYLPNVKDTDLFNPSNYDAQAIRTAYGLADNKILMFTGTAKSDQGLEDILQALDNLNDDSFKLVLVGGNPRQRDYLNTLQGKWQRWIIHLPAQAFDGMAQFVAMAHVVMVTPRESTRTIGKCPFELVEGMAMAKPIIATQVGEIPNILGDTGYLIPPQDCKSMEAKLREIFDNYDRATVKGESARQRCISNYSMNNLTNTLKQVLQLVI